MVHAVEGHRADIRRRDLGHGAGREGASAGADPEHRYSQPSSLRESLDLGAFPLGRRLSITKQSAAKTIAVLQEGGYVARDTDPLDARRKRLQVTALGLDMLRQGETIFDELRDQWSQQIGIAELENFETQLAAMVGAQPVRFDTPGRLTHDLGFGPAVGRSSSSG